MYNLNQFYPELGGYVIEISSDGSHGSVIAMQDQGWIGITWIEAAQCINDPAYHDANGGKFKDWRFPSKKELTLMYQIFKGKNLPNFDVDNYWGSQEAGPDGLDVRYKNFRSGDDYVEPQFGNDACKLRAVRDF